MENGVQHYDYAILGGGAAGLSLIVHLLRQNGLANGKRLLLVDPEVKEGHDHTWSLWEREPGPFDQLVYHRWKQLAVHDDRYSLDLPLDKYQYKLIRSTEFYEYCNRLIEEHPAIDRLQAKATDIQTGNDQVSFRADGKDLRADWAFSSLADRLDFRSLQRPYLDQHFRGWFVKTAAPTFDPGLATIMDFRLPQGADTRFFYVLPFTEDYALVEIAVFSNDLWSRERYDQALSEYLEKHWLNKSAYSIEHTEQGVIPMTTHAYPRQDGRLVYIGIAGGHARASTGYTFFNIQRQTEALAKQLTGPDQRAKFSAAWPLRHRMYDSTLLRILQDQRLAGSEVFVDLFRQNPTERLLAFLNGESSLGQELRLMSSTRISTFAPTFFQEMWR